MQKWISVGVCLDREMWLAIKEQYPDFNLSQFVRDALNNTFEAVEA